MLWSYDAGTNGMGRLTGMSDKSGNTIYSYDLQGRLLNKTQTAKFGTINFTQTLSYQYDSMGRLERMTYPSGIQITTTYGADGRPTELRVNGNLLLSNIIYQPFGEPKSWVWGNGQAYTRGFDLDGRLKTHPVGSDTRTLTYDAANRITQTTDSNPVYNRSYDYDALNRLTGQVDNTSFKLWNYDANSNRTLTQIGGTSYSYTLATTSNRLLDVVGPAAKTYNYDAAGNPLSDGTATFIWNAVGQLSKIIKNGKTHRYKYNAFGQRITKNGRLSKKYFFLYDPAGQLIGEYKNNAATAIPTDDWLIRQETVWLGDIPIAVLRKPVATEPVQIYYIHTDHLNTPRLIADQSNTPVWRWDNVHAFGANLPDEDPDGNGQLFEYNPRFPGQYFDKEAGLHYNYFRYYEPETGRYLSPDPIGLTGGLNTYGYVEQNPVSFVDPTGENPVLLWALGGALTLWDMLKPMQPNSQYPDAIESVWTIPGPVGNTKKLCEVTNKGTRTTILGENMTERVVPYANRSKARTLPFGTTPENWSKLNPKERWKLNDGILRARIKEGDNFLFIGRDPYRDPLLRKQFDLTGSELLRLNERGIPFETSSPSNVKQLIRK
jgi:RHS repeat-associated protein